jgi:predicted site-specific integrase-resolvase
MEKTTKASNVTPLLITGKEACEILGISYSCWRIELAKGHIKGVEIGNRTKYNRQDIINLCTTK